jgi:hypothetical protein
MLLTEVGTFSAHQIGQNSGCIGIAGYASLICACVSLWSPALSGSTTVLADVTILYPSGVSRFSPGSFPGPAQLCLPA